MNDQEILNKIMGVVTGKIDPKDLIPSRKEHRKVSLLNPIWREVVEVDEGIAELIALLWQAEIEIRWCSQENRPGDMFIRFESADNMAKFFNMLAINRDKELGDRDSLYHRVIDTDQEGGWEYDLLVQDIGYEINEGNEVVYTRSPEIIISAAVFFPISDYPQVLKCVKQYLASN